MHAELSWSPSATSCFILPSYIAGRGLLGNHTGSLSYLSTYTTMSFSVERQPSFDDTVGKVVVLESSSVSFVHWGKWDTSIIRGVYPTNDAMGALGYQSDFHLVDEIRWNSRIAVGDRPPIYTVDIGPGKSTVSPSGDLTSATLANCTAEPSVVVVN